MKLETFKITMALVIFFITIVSGWLPLQKKAKSGKSFEFPQGEALACGIFLGAGLIHMLNDSTQSFLQANIHYPLSFLLAGSMFLLLLWIEHACYEINDEKGTQNKYFILLAVLMLSIHSLFAGAALGITQDWSLSIILLLAILGHKWATSFALAMQINKNNINIKIGMVLFFIYALMVPLGIFIGNFLSKNLLTHALLEPILIALAAGTFLYMGTLHGLKNAVMVERCCNLYHFSYVVIGFTFMAIIAIWL